MLSYESRNKMMKCHLKSAAQWVVTPLFLSLSLHHINQGVIHAFLFPLLFLTLSIPLVSLHWLLLGTVDGESRGDPLRDSAQMQSAAICEGERNVTLTHRRRARFFWCVLLSEKQSSPHNPMPFWSLLGNSRLWRSKVTWGSRLRSVELGQPFKAGFLVGWVITCTELQLVENHTKYLYIPLHCSVCCTFFHSFSSRNLLKARVWTNHCIN